MKQNCWDFNQCGRGPHHNGKDGLTSCPAFTQTSCSGLNKGINGGRMCWAVAGTFSQGSIKGVFARELSCLNCDFLRLVCEEEGICNAESLTPQLLYHHRSDLFGRRKLMRIDVYLDITLIPPGEIAETVGVTNDFSSEGFSFISENIQTFPGMPFSFGIMSPVGDETVSVLGDIVWKKEVRDRCIAGVQIRHMQQAVKNTILNYAYERWAEGVHLH